MDGAVQTEIGCGNIVISSVATNKSHSRVQGSSGTLLSKGLHSQGEVAGDVLQVVRDKHTSSLNDLHHKHM